MLYPFKVRLLKTRVGRYSARARSIFNPRFRALLNREGVRVGLIKQYAPGKSFADIGCMWGVNGGYSFVAERAGATSVIANDVSPITHAFVQQHRAQHSRVLFIQGDINNQSTARAIGCVDVVFCSGVLYHVPDPLYFLFRLRAICGERLILGTKLIPEMPVKNGAVFYPYLDDDQRRLWRYGGTQLGVERPYDPADSYGNWFWGLTPSCVEALLHSAGFVVEERFVEPFNGHFVCRLRADAAPALY